MKEEVNNEQVVVHVYNGPREVNGIVYVVEGGEVFNVSVHQSGVTVEPPLYLLTHRSLGPSL